MVSTSGLVVPHGVSRSLHTVQGPSHHMHDSQAQVLGIDSNSSQSSYIVDSFNYVFLIVRLPYGLMAVLNLSKFLSCL